MKLQVWIPQWDSAISVSKSTDQPLKNTNMKIDNHTPTTSIKRYYSKVYFFLSLYKKNLQITHSHQKYIIYIEKYPFYYNAHYDLLWRPFAHSDSLFHTMGNNGGCDLLTSDAQLYTRCVHDQTSSNSLQQMGHRVIVRTLPSRLSLLSPGNRRWDVTQFYTLPGWLEELYQDNVQSRLGGSYTHTSTKSWFLL